MIRLEKIRKLYRSQKILTVSSSSNFEINLEKLEKDSTITDHLLTDDAEAKLREGQIEKSRNKSGLNNSLRNILHGKNPYPEPKLWHHGTLKYIRKLYGTYGVASGVNPSICFPLKEELDDKKEYERVAFPKTIPQMIDEVKQNNREIEDRKMLRQKNIGENMKKLDQWKQDLYNRIQKKEKEMRAAKEKKEKLIEEVRQHFGYTVDPKDEKFKELLEKKEKAEKKAAKEAKRQARHERMLAELEKKSANTKKDGNKTNTKEQHTEDEEV